MVYADFSKFTVLIIKLKIKFEQIMLWHYTLDSLKKKRKKKKNEFQRWTKI